MAVEWGRGGGCGIEEGVGSGKEGWGGGEVSEGGWL